MHKAREKKEKTPRFKKALITGASSGIGQEYATALARRGCDLILSARRLERLHACAEQLRSEYAIAVTVVGADLACEEGISAVEQVIAENDDIDLLINNAGFGLGGLFSELPLCSLTDMLRVHTVAPVRFSKAVLAQMKARGAGTIINIASTAGHIPVPGSAVYPATKAFLISFSQALAHEARAYGIRIQALCPGFTYSEFHDTPAFKNFKRSDLPGYAWMQAEEVVARSLRHVGKKKVVYIPGLFNKILVICAGLPILETILAKQMLEKKGLKT
jgi:uncharacterized protein